MGVLPLHKMLPMTLGANIGTTFTAMLASLVALKFGGVQIALCHLFFNVMGIFIWFPIVPMRRVPLYFSELLGMYASNWRWIPVVYVMVMFVLMPLLLMGVSFSFEASLQLGAAISVTVVAAL